MITWSTAIVAIFLAIHFWPQPPSPVPAAVKEETTFSIIYPSGYRVDPSSWKYLTQEESLQFSVKKGDTEVVFTEQKTPLAYQNDLAAYNRFIGSLRPKANFDVPLGTVSIGNFVTSGNYQVVGDTGILNSRGTLLFVHPDHEFSDDDWRTLFESLRID